MQGVLDLYLGKSLLLLVSCMPGCGVYVGKNGLNLFNCWSVAIGVVGFACVCVTVCVGGVGAERALLMTENGA